MNLSNVLTVYKMSKVFNLPTPARQSLSYIESCFTILADTQNFLELDYKLVANILASSELHIDSEVEIFNSAYEWIKHNFNERERFVKRLLLKVRLILLSDQALRNILSDESPFTAVQDCVEIINKVLNKKFIMNEIKSSSQYKHRCCNSRRFNILALGGREKVSKINVKSVIQINGNSLKTMESLAPLLRVRNFSQAVCIKDKIYIFGGYFDWTVVTSVDSYSAKTKKWRKIAEIYDSREGYCVSAFMDKVFLLGGRFCNSCIKFDTINCTWTVIKGMKESRSWAASTVFEGNLVVSGGGTSYFEDLRTVESYDVFADKWSRMPAMCAVKSFHSLVVALNKLFVIGEDSDICEVFDNACKKFVALKTPKFTSAEWKVKTFSIGCRIFVYTDDTDPLWCYDVNEDKWSKKNFDIGRKDFSWVKVPRF